MNSDIDYIEEQIRAMRSRTTADMSASGLGDLTTYTVVPCIDLDMGGWGGTVDPALSEASMLVDYLKVWRLA